MSSSPTNTAASPVSQLDAYLSSLAQPKANAPQTPASERIEVLAVAPPQMGTVPVTTPRLQRPGKLARSFRNFRKRTGLFYATVAVSALTLGLAIGGIGGRFFKGDVMLLNKGTMSLTTSSPNPVAGSELLVNVHLNTMGEKVNGFQANLRFDRNYLKLVDADPNTPQIDALSPLFPLPPDNGFKCLLVESKDGIEQQSSVKCDEANAVNIGAFDPSNTDHDAVDTDILTLKFEATRDVPSTTIRLLFNAEATESSASRNVTEEERSSGFFAASILDGVEDLVLNISPSGGETVPGGGTSSMPPNSTPPTQEEVSSTPPVGEEVSSTPPVGEEVSSTPPVAQPASLPPTRIPSSSPVPPTADPTLPEMRMTIQATPTSVTGEQEVKLTIVLNATQPVTSATLRSGQGFGGKVFGGDDASLEYIPESVTIAGAAGTTVSGGLESGGILFSNLPAGDTTIRLRAKTSPGRLAQGQREPVTDMLEIRDGNLLTGRVLASGTYTVTVQRTASPAVSPTPGTPGTPSAPSAPNPGTPGGSTPGTVSPGTGTTNPGTGSSPGAGTNPQNQGRTTTPPPAQGGSTPVNAGAGAGPFPDVPLSHPAAVAITKLKARGALQGYENGLFGPDGTISRAEVAKILMLATATQPDMAAPLPADSDPANFPGDPPYQRFADAIRTAVARGWMSSGGGNFVPWASVKDTDAKVIISRATGTAAAYGSQAPVSRAQFCIELARTLGL